MNITPKQWSRVEELFHEALRLPVGEREPFLLAQLGVDLATIDAVRRLLAASDSGAAVVIDRDLGRLS